MDQPDEKLSLAKIQDVADALAHALQFEGRRRVSGAHEAMAHITAERLCKYLNRSRFVVMQRPPLEAHGMRMTKASDKLDDD